MAEKRIKGMIPVMHSKTVLLCMVLGLTACIRFIDLDEYEPPIRDCGTCGDGHTRCDEQCDDGNLDPGDGCDPQCNFEAHGLECGDFDPVFPEVCDDGNHANGDSCNPTCNFRNDVTNFVGTCDVQGYADGRGAVATLGGWGSLAVVNNSLWFGDAGNHIIRRIDLLTGSIETIAGSLSVAHSIDASRGINAGFSTVESLATDGITVWVADGQRVRAVDAFPPYMVRTVAGDERLGCDDGLAPTFDDIRGLVYHAGHLWMLDANCATVRRLNPDTGEVVTVAGQAYATGYVDGIGPEARFESPRYMTSDLSGTMFISDTNGAAIRTLNIRTGQVGTFAGNGQQDYVDGVGQNARIHRPRGITFDGTSLYFVEADQNTIRQGILSTREISTMIGSPEINMPGCTEGTGHDVSLNVPFDIVYHFSEQSLFFVDSGSFLIRRVH